MSSPWRAQPVRVGGLSGLVGRWPPEPGRPTLLFIHGSGGAAVMWGPQLEGLARVATTVAVDLPGHGDSPGPGCSSVAAYAAAVAEAVTRAGLGPVVACGLSLGGAIVQQLLLDHPTWLTAGILCSTGAKLKVAPAILQAVRADYPAFVASQASWMVAPGGDPSVLAGLLAATAALPPEVTAGDFEACDAFDVRARLGSINRPVLVLSGADDGLTPPTYSDYLAARIPGARRVQLAAAGHLVPLEQPAGFNAAVQAFMASLGSP